MSEEVWSLDESSVIPRIYNSKTKKFYTLYDAIAELLNRVEN